MTTFRREACNTLRSMTASLKVQETLHKMSGREVAHLVVLALPSSTAAIFQTPRPALLPDAWHRPLFHFPHYEPERSAAPTYTHDLEQMHPKAHARDDRGSMLSNDRLQSSPGGGSTDGLSAQPTAPHHFLAENAARCIGHRSALLSSSQRAATDIAPQCTKMRKTVKNSRLGISPSHERSSYTFPTLQQGPVVRHFHSQGNRLREASHSTRAVEHVAMLWRRDGLTRGTTQPVGNRFSPLGREGRHANLPTFCIFPVQDTLLFIVKHYLCGHAGERPCVGTDARTTPRHNPSGHTGERPVERASPAAPHSENIKQHYIHEKKDDFTGSRPFSHPDGWGGDT